MTRHGHLARHELGQAATHLHAASAHATGAAAGSATTAYLASRDALASVVVPLVGAARAEARRASRTPGRGRRRAPSRWTFALCGVVIGGAVAAAYVAMRRSRTGGGPPDALSTAANRAREAPRWAWDTLAHLNPAGRHRDPSTVEPIRDPGELGWPA